MNQALTTEEKQKILEAYKLFQRELRDITHDHRSSVKDILGQIDIKQIEALEQQIKNA